MELWNSISSDSGWICSYIPSKVDSNTRGIINQDAMARFFNWHNLYANGSSPCQYC